MRNFVIFVDSTADLATCIRNKYGIEYCQMNINYEGKELPASLDWDVYSPKELYDWMREGKVIKTSQVPYQTFYEKFSEVLKQGLDILYISCSSALSGSINTALNVKDELAEDYPDRKIYCIDSLISSLGQGYLAIKAAQMADEGKDIDEIAKWVVDNRLKVNQIATVASLEYLKRAGRIKTSKAFFGNLFNVKPLIISDVIGQNYAFKKVKGRHSSLVALAEYLKENIVDPENQIIGISHADSYEDAVFVKEEIMKLVPVKDVYIDYIGPIVGSSVGPGTVDVYFVGNEVTIKGE